MRIKGLSRDIEKNREPISELVNAVNALLIPRACLGVDKDGLLHVTIIEKQRALPGIMPGELRSLGGDSTPSLSIQVSYNADVIWGYRQWDNTVTCKKSRGLEWVTGTTYVLEEVASHV